MEPIQTEKSAYSIADNGQKIYTEMKYAEDRYAETKHPDDKAVLELAKRRLAAKRNLIGQVLDFALILFSLFILIAFYDNGDRLAFSFFFSMFWGIRLLVRILKFAKPSFSRGIVAYFNERREHKLEAEYNRLRRMSSEYVASELNK